MSMKRYNHVFTLYFSIDTDASCETEHDYPSDKEIVSAILKRVADIIENDEMEEAIGVPSNTYENEDIYENELKIKANAFDLMSSGDCSHPDRAWELAEYAANEEKDRS